MTKNDRLTAIRILLKVLESKVSLSHLLQENSDTSPLTKAICYGVCRHYFRLQALADSLVTKRPQALDVWLVLLMGLYQLQFLNKPEYATVKETVDLLDKLKKTWAKGLINAVLRRFCRERNEILAAIEKQSEYIEGHPSWFVALMQKDWPTLWPDILKHNDAHPPMSLRVNRLQSTRDSYLQRLQDAGIAAQAHHYSATGIMLDSPADINELPGFSNGAVSVQDEAAQLAVDLLALQPGLRVLDACAAPGGKTCHILETEPELELCVALDIDETRLKRVRDNLERLQLQARVIQGDALEPSTWWDGQFFDRILLDAPCSATGVIRRHPDIKLLRTEQDIRAITAIQKAILQSMWSVLKPGGLLVYATCSVIKQENEQQIASFIAERSDAEFIGGEKPWGQATGSGWQLLPGDSNCDGFFYSVLRKGE